MRRYLLLFLYAWVLLMFSQGSLGHEIRPAFLQLKQINTAHQGQHTIDTFEVVWKKPMLNGKQFSIYPVFPKSCKPLSTRKISKIPGAIKQKWLINCQKHHYLHQNIVINGLTSTMTDVFLQVKWVGQPISSVLLNANKNFVQLGSLNTPSNNINQSFFMKGLEHLLSGYDHILLIFLLVLLINRTKTLLLTLSTFTIAHSITLTLASFNMIELNLPLVESLITLSLLILAVDVSLQIKQTNRDLMNPVLVAFLFGLIHGLGFAANFQLNLQQQHSIIYPLLFFNLGIEAGQIMVVVMLLSLFWCVNLFAKSLVLFKQSALFAAGTIATFWFLQSVHILFFSI